MTDLVITSQVWWREWGTGYEAAKFPSNTQHSNPHDRDIHPFTRAAWLEGFRTQRGLPAPTIDE